MKDFEMPTVKIVALDVVDIITTSNDDEWSSSSDVEWNG